MPIADNFDDQAVSGHFDDLSADLHRAHSRLSAGETGKLSKPSGLFRAVWGERWLDGRHD